MSRCTELPVLAVVETSQNLGGKCGALRGLQPESGFEDVLGLTFCETSVTTRCASMISSNPHDSLRDARSAGRRAPRREGRSGLALCGTFQPSGARSEIGLAVKAPVTQ